MQQQPMQHIPWFGNLRSKTEGTFPSGLGFERSIKAYKIPRREALLLRHQGIRTTSTVTMSTGTLAAFYGSWKQ